MEHTGHQEDHNSAPRKFWSRGNIVLIAFLAVGGFLLIAEHRAHLWGYWPFLILLACPLLHVFMHGGHGGHGGAGEDQPPQGGKPGTGTPPSASAGHRH
jgi:hypothetical protein